MALRRSRSRNAPRSSVEPLGVGGATIETRHPDIAVDPDELRDVADSVIGVLDGEGYAVGPWTPAIDAEALRRGLRTRVMEITRRRRGPDKPLAPSVAPD